jgi:thiol-disulfide isomerase/thioredoxin
MKYLILFVLLSCALFSCDHVENPYPQTVSLELDTTLYPGLWQDYIDNEWPQFSANTNTNRNVIIEDFTGHKCVYCPAAADFAHQLYEENPGRVFVASIHAGPTGMGDFQTVSPPDYPTDFTNPNGLEIGEYFGINDGGFVGNPRGTVNRINNGVIFQSPAVWSSMTSDVLTGNDLKVNLQSHLNYYDETNGAFLHVEIDKIDQSITDDLGLVVYLLEDSLVGDQKMSDNSHNTEYVHRDIHRKNISGQSFGRILQDEDLDNGKYLLNYSFKVPTQLDGVYNAENMHLLVYVYNVSTWEIYQVIKQGIVP